MIVCNALVVLAKILYQYVVAAELDDANVVCQFSETFISVSHPAATVLVAFALMRVPLGLPALSVSIRTQRATDGLPTLARLSLRVVPAAPLPNTGKETRVLAVTSPIFCAEVACAVVGAGSLNTTFQTESVSQAGYDLSVI